ncbi:NB-ARC domain-containing protein [Candidatus Enterococcus lemimoniae]|uniref:NB-ARC domain-containing protein n=1 Tax=Candidatus Enterococcus lemimoniae TaxID=1834167 RepID=A0ABZ2TA28_9ENTE
MFSFSLFCKTFSLHEKGGKGEIAKQLSYILAPKYKGADETFIRMFNGEHKCRDLYKGINDILSAQDTVIEFPNYIHKVSQKLSDKRNSFNFETNKIDELNSIIESSINLTSSVQEGLLKSYKINRKKKVFVFLAEALYYSVCAQHGRLPEYKEVKGRFSEKYQELLTQSPYALTNTYKERTEKDEIWEALIDDSQKIILKGLSGIGKSEFAKDIWKTTRESEICNYLAWINYEGDLESSIYNQFLDLVDEPLETKRNKLNKMLREMDNDLFIIIDNFYSTEEKDKFLIELSGRNCHVLVTTKELLNYSGFENYELGSLSEENCVSLFKNYYTLEDDESKMNSIMNSIGRHTLLLELMAKNAYVEEFTLDELIELISENGIDYSDVKVDSTHEFLLTEETIIRQTQLLFSSMQKRLSEEEIDLLIKFAIFKTLPFNKKLIEKWFELSDTNYLSRLEKLGWISCEYRESNKYYSIHQIPAYCLLSQYNLSSFFEIFIDRMFSVADIGDSKLKDLAYYMTYVQEFLETFNNLNYPIESISIPYYEIQKNMIMLNILVAQDIVRSTEKIVNAKKYVNFVESNLSKMLIDKKKDGSIPEDECIFLFHTLCFLGNNYMDIGKSKTAKRLYELARSLLVEENKSEYLIYLVNLFNLYQNDANYESILKHINTMLTFMLENFNESTIRREIIVTLVSIADYQIEVGLDSFAEMSLELASTKLQFSRNELDKNTYILFNAIITEQQGCLCVIRKDYEEAKNFFSSAYEEIKYLLGDSHPKTVKLAKALISLDSTSGFSEE